MKPAREVVFPDTMELNADFIRLVEPMIDSVWNAIGFDWLEIDPSAADAMEGVLDSDRLEDYGGPDGPAALQFLRRMYKQHGYDTVYEFLSKKIRLG